MPVRKTAPTTGMWTIAPPPALSAVSQIIKEADDLRNDLDDQGNENGMLEMLNMLQEFQKRKASKTSSRSAAFQTKKNALFADIRASVDTIVREGAIYIDECNAKIDELRSREIMQEKHMQDLSLLCKSQDSTIRGLLETYPTLIEDLSHRRAAQINDASAMLEGHAQERQDSRRRLIHLAKARADENLERQKLAADATALIKHYKALLLA